MKSLSSAFGSFHDQDELDFDWFRVAASQPRYSLRSESKLMVGLRWDTRTLATVDCAQGRFIFETLSSLTGQHLEIRQGGHKSRLPPFVRGGTGAD
jgi:hypothetical protein